jgi:hypothetical protein
VNIKPSDEQIRPSIFARILSIQLLTALTRSPKGTETAAQASLLKGLWSSFWRAFNPHNSLVLFQPASFPARVAKSKGSIDGTT